MVYSHISWCSHGSRFRWDPMMASRQFDDKNLTCDVFFDPDPETVAKEHGRNMSYFSFHISYKVYPWNLPIFPYSVSSFRFKNGFAMKRPTFDFFCTSNQPLLNEHNYGTSPLFMGTHPPFQWSFSTANCWSLPEGESHRITWKKPAFSKGFHSHQLVDVFHPQYFWIWARPPTVGWSQARRPPGTYRRGRRVGETQNSAVNSVSAAKTRENHIKL